MLGYCLGESCRNPRQTPYCYNLMLFERIKSFVHISIDSMGNWNGRLQPSDSILERLTLSIEGSKKNSIRTGGQGEDGTDTP